MSEANPFFLFLASSRSLKKNCPRNRAKRDSIQFERSENIGAILNTFLIFRLLIIKKLLNAFRQSESIVIRAFQRSFSTIYLAILHHLPCKNFSILHHLPCIIHHNILWWIYIIKITGGRCQN